MTNPAETQTLGNDGLPWPQTWDAQLWADEFCRRHPAMDPGTALSWFANAIMCGYDTGSRMTGESAINIIFDGPPGPESGRFIEVETDDGRSFRAGEWIERPDGLWSLRITDIGTANHGDQGTRTTGSHPLAA